ncbi:hypothetical protein PR003_g17146 [Phytophthora rubi]|uniref:Helicase-associated domain-containing protein n=2 Tax=Phytophthora rubi TaxID=129364 RepID=A0A6A4EI42_9STRA|nr:hypothetical protein PR001_g1863 [Phytophthora rubi]KAE9322747.1 hypothetical protein PR003_g17146 [Phytophthora rubi]
MLRLSARRGWRLARPLQTAPVSAFSEPIQRFALASPRFSSTPSEGQTSSGGAVRNEPKVDMGHWRTAAWEPKILAALRTYKQLNGHLIVPRPFVVPSGDARWSVVTWGYNLGKAVSDLRTKSKSKARLSTEMEEELEKLDFVYDVYQFKWDRIILPALREFYRVHGHTDVPHDFIVPIGDEAWPKLAWGSQLGQTVVKIRHREAYSTQRCMSKEELDRMGFCYDMSIPERDWTEKTLPSIRVYRQVFGDCIIPMLFIVPSLPPWPEKAWGMALGAAVSKCRGGTYYMDQVARDREVLDSVGFVWDCNEAVWNEVIFPALEAYVDVHKNGKVPYGFVVPSEDPWPRKSWGKRLGDALSRMRNKGTYFEQYGRDIEKLDELGLKLKLLPPAWNRRVIPLLDTYAELHGEGEVPLDFVILSEAPWEKKMWGVRLGLIVARNPQFTRK